MYTRKGRRFTRPLAFSFTGLDQNSDEISRAFEAMQLTLALFGLFCVFATPAGKIVDANSGKSVAMF